jgi:predicted Fe-S protein YdhL (DUF1289 family)
MTTAQLCVDTVKVLTDKIHDSWQQAGYLKQQYSLTYMEINHLVRHFLKICTQQSIDYQEHDLSSILDHTLNYYENLAEIENKLGCQPTGDDYSKWMDEAQEEKQNIEDLTQKNLELERKNKKISAMLKQAEATKQQPQPTPTPQPQQPATPTTVINQVFYDSAMYTQAELIEIFEYLHNRHSLKHKITKAFASKKHVLRDRVRQSLL